MADKRIWDLPQGSFGTSSKIPVGNTGDVTEYIEGLDIINYITSNGVTGPTGPQGEIGPTGPGYDIWRPSFGANSIENYVGNVRVGDNSLGFNTSSLQIYDDNGSSNIILGSDVALFGNSTDNFIFGNNVNTSGLFNSYIFGRNHVLSGAIGLSNNSLRILSDGNYIGNTNSSAFIASAGTTIGDNTGNVATIGGNGNTILDGVNDSVIIGGSGLTASENNTVYTPNIVNDLKITTSELKITIGASAGRIPVSDASGNLTLTDYDPLLYFDESQSNTGLNITTPSNQLSVVGTYSDIDIILSPKGTGAFSTHLADGTSLGGNKRGTRATDFQRDRATASQVATGNNSFIAGGRNNTADGAHSHAEGSGNIITTSGNSAHVEGAGNTASAAQAHAEGRNNIASNTAAHVQNSENQAGAIDAHVGGRGNIIQSGASSGFVHSTTSTLQAGAIRSAILGGQNITGTQSDTVYVPNLISIGNVNTSTFRLTTGAVSGRVLTSDANGNGTWTAPVDTNIANSDLTISTPGTRFLRMAGTQLTDVFQIENASSGRGIFRVYGDGHCEINDGVSPSAPNKLWINNTTVQTGLRATNNFNSGTVSTTKYGGLFTNTGAGPGDVIGIMGQSISPANNSTGIQAFGIGTGAINYGLFAQAANGTAQNVGIYSIVTGAQPGAYFGQFRDGVTEATGKVMASMTVDGRAQWQKVTSTYTTGASGTFSSVDGKLITVTNGLITSIV